MSAAFMCLAAGLCVLGVETEITREQRCLLDAYPEHLCSVRSNMLFWCDGTVMQWDSGRTYEDFDELLNNADLADQMSIEYPLGRDYTIPLPENFDPGRVRSEAFFRKMYGGRAEEVRATLEPIVWLPEHAGKKLWVTGVNDVHVRLGRVSDDLAKVDPRVRGQIEETSGTFVWRVIKGTSRASMHSFAIAVDVGVPISDYWRWNKPGPDGIYPYKNRMPLEVVEIFERHGFIWGGKWYHFDTMHFEYRPELILCGGEQ